MSFNSNYKRRRKPTCKLCRRRLKLCNYDSLDKRRSESIQSRYTPSQTCFFSPRITAYFPYCANFGVNEFSDLFTKVLEKLLQEAVQEWDVPVSTFYKVDVGVAIGGSNASGEPEDDLVWCGGPLFVPQRGHMDEPYTQQMLTQLKTIIFDILNVHPYLSFINCVVLELIKRHE